MVAGGMQMVGVITTNIGMPMVGVITNQFGMPMVGVIMNGWMNRDAYGWCYHQPIWVNEFTPANYHQIQHT